MVVAFWILNWVDLTEKEDGYFQLKVSLKTRDSMANFINTVLEEYANLLKEIICTENGFTEKSKHYHVYCFKLYTRLLVRAWVECKVEELGEVSGISAADFAQKFKMGVRIAEDTH